MWNFKCPGWNPRRFSVGREGRLSQVEDEPDCDVYNDRITVLPNSGRNSSVKAMMKKNSMAFEEKNKQATPLGATKHKKRNDQYFIVLNLALELSKYRYRGYFFCFELSFRV